MREKIGSDGILVEKRKKSRFRDFYSWHHCSILEARFLWITRSQHYITLPDYHVKNLNTEENSSFVQIHQIFIRILKNWITRAKNWKTIIYKLALILNEPYSNETRQKDGKPGQMTSYYVSQADSWSNQVELNCKMKADNDDDNNDNNNNNDNDISQSSAGN